MQAAGKAPSNEQRNPPPGSFDVNVNVKEFKLFCAMATVVVGGTVSTVHAKEVPCRIRSSPNIHRLHFEGFRAPSDKLEYVIGETHAAAAAPLERA